MPNALVLYHSVIDTSAGGYGQKKTGEAWGKILPLLAVRVNLPPTIVFHGTYDVVTTYTGAVSFRDRMLRVGNRCELVSHTNGGHGYLIFDLLLFLQVIERTLRFTEQTVRRTGKAAKMN